MSAGIHTAKISVRRARECMRRSVHMHRVLVLGATSDSTLPACSYEWKPARDSSACIASGSGARTGSRTGPAVTRTKGTGARVVQGYRRTYRRRGAWAQGWLLTGLATAARKNAASRCNLCIVTPFCSAPCHTYVVHNSHDLCIFSLQMACCVPTGRRPEGVMVDEQ